jgi:hypothetical protein
MGPGGRASPSGGDAEALIAGIWKPASFLFRHTRRGEWCDPAAALGAPYAPRLRSILCHSRTGATIYAGFDETLRLPRTDPSQHRNGTNDPRLAQLPAALGYTPDRRRRKSLSFGVGLEPTHRRVIDRPPLSNDEHGFRKLFNSINFELAFSKSGVLRSISPLRGAAQHGAPPPIGMDVDRWDLHRSSSDRRKP